MSWKGDSQATAPIGRKASTNVMMDMMDFFFRCDSESCFEWATPELSFEVILHVRGKYPYKGPGRPAHLNPVWWAGKGRLNRETRMRRTGQYSVRY